MALSQASVCRALLWCCVVLMSALCLSFLQTSGNDEIQQLQKALLDHLEENAETAPALIVSDSSGPLLVDVCILLFEESMCEFE